MLVLILIVTATVMIGGFLYAININQRVVNAKIDRSKAFYHAEAGINKAIYYLAYTAPNSSTDGSWRTEAYPAIPGSYPTNPQQETFSDGTYTMWLEDAGGNILIRARGTMNNTIRTISVEVKLTQTTPNVITTVDETWMEI